MRAEPAAPEPVGEPVYIHGHHASVLRSHMWRTAENSCAYLVDRLAPGMDVLDVGCGPGTITRDLAARVEPGRCVGLDRAVGVIADAAAGDEMSRFSAGDTYALPVRDECVDVVHAHQVLQHLTDPVAALREMGRVLRPGGLLAVRDSVYRSFCWAPDDPLLDRWNDLYHRVAEANAAYPDAGVHLPAWVADAGFVDIEVSSSTWTFADPADREWWAELWAERVVASTFAEQALARRLADRSELEAIAEAFTRWADSPTGVFVILHGEVIARRPER